jgi:hypothetical protein
MVGKHRIQTFEVAVVVLLRLLLSFDGFVPTSAHLLLVLDKWFVQIYLNVSYLYDGPHHYYRVNLEYHSDRFISSGSH